MYHIVTDNFVNLLHISYPWLYKTECCGRKFCAFSFNSHRNCKIFMTNFNFIFDTICLPYIFRKSIFGWNYDHDTPLCDTPLLEDTPLCDTPDELYLLSSVMSQISRKNSFGKVVFPFLVRNFLSRDRSWLFGRHIVIVYPIFDFFAVFWFFWITLSLARISPPNSFGKVLFWVRVHRDPPWPLTGVQKALTT